MREYIVLDAKVAGYIIHHNNHLNLDFLSKDARAVMLPIAGTDRTMSVEDIFKQFKDRVNTIAKYLELAKSNKDAQLGDT